MPDPDAVLDTQLRNIRQKTGKTLAQLGEALSASGLTKHSEQRSYLMDAVGIGYGDANTVVHALKRLATPTSATDDPLAAIYVGAKAHLRGIHEQLMIDISAFGEFELAPKKACVSLRRKKQFAMVGPATKSQIEVGINVREIPPNPRAKSMPPASMCRYTVRLSNLDEIDTELLGWVRSAFDEAG